MLTDLNPRRRSMADSSKLSQQINVKLTEQDIVDINEFITSCHADVSPGKVLRMAWRLMRKSVQEQGALGLLMKVLDEN